MTRDRDIWAAIPFKGFDRAKQRLSPCCSPEFRRAIVKVMFEDVLDAVAAVPELAGITVITRDPEAIAIARSRRLATYNESSTGHSGVVMEFSDVLARQGRGGILALPADIPAVTAAELSQLIAAHRHGAAFTIAPAADKFGSNAIVLTPPGGFPLRFGPDSFNKHLAVAGELGISPTVLDLPGIALDIDTPDDCRTYLLRPGPTRTWKFLSQNFGQIGPKRPTSDCEERP